MKIGDGFCHDYNNNYHCSFDGGDCCGPCVNKGIHSFPFVLELTIKKVENSPMCLIIHWWGWHRFTSSKQLEKDISFKAYLASNYS